MHKDKKVRDCTSLPKANNLFYTALQDGIFDDDGTGCSPCVGGGYFTIRSHGGVRQFWVAFGSEISKEKCLIFAKDSGDAQVWNNYQFSFSFVVQTLARNHIPILRLDVKILLKFWDWVIAEVLVLGTLTPI